MLLKGDEGITCVGLVGRDGGMQGREGGRGHNVWLARAPGRSSSFVVANGTGKCEMKETVLSGPTGFDLL